MRTLRTGIIGGGFIGPQHVEAVRRLGYVDIVAIAEGSPELANAVAGKLFIPRAYGSYQELLADPDVDVIHNCTPNVLHYEINRAALEAGKHVISEKPLAMNSSETATLVQVAARSGRVAAVNFNHRGYPMAQQARHMIATGLLGDVRLLHGAYLQDWLLYPTDWSWRLDPVKGGASRAMADIGVHWADLMQHVTGHRISRVFADLRTLLPKRFRPTQRVQSFGGSADAANTEAVDIATEDEAMVIFETEQGARGSFMVSQVSAGHKNRLSFEVNGSQASVGWDADAPDQLWIGYRDKPNECLAKDPTLVAPEVAQYVHLPGGHAEAWPDALKNVMAAIYAAIRDGRTGQGDIFATFADGHHAALLVDAVLESARQSAWVDVHGQ